MVSSVAVAVTRTQYSIAYLPAENDQARDWLEAVGTNLSER